MKMHRHSFFPPRVGVTMTASTTAIHQNWAEFADRVFPCFSMVSRRKPPIGPKKYVLKMRGFHENLPEDMHHPLVLLSGTSRDLWSIITHPRKARGWIHNKLCIYFNTFCFKIYQHSLIYLQTTPKVYFEHQQICHAFFPPKTCVENSTPRLRHLSPFFWAPAPFGEDESRPTLNPLQVASLTVVTWMLRCLELVSEAKSHGLA